MKKLTLLFTAFLCLAFTANVLGQVKESAIDCTITDTKYDIPHVVAIGSKFNYVVDKHQTLTFEQLKKVIADNTYSVPDGEKLYNRYAWELYSVDLDVDVDGKPIKDADGNYTYKNRKEVFVFANEDKRFEEATKEIGGNEKLYQWNDKEITGLIEDGYYLIRVSEYANHGIATGTSLTADKDTKVISEIVVKIGEEIQIYIPKTDAQNDYFYCYQDGDKDDRDAFLNKIDSNAGLTTLKFNGRPGAKTHGEKVDGFKFKLALTKFQEGDTDANNGQPQDVFIEIAANDPNLKYLADEGYYTYDFGLETIKDEINDIDASSKDLYYTVEVVGFLHGDSEDENTYTHVIAGVKDGSSVQPKDALKKVNRTYGFYTKPVITKINHK